ncbi:MAG TPA: Flp family type IVb pilin [Stellaceae bacterium]|nr:Flp family type IVb pilin [Stellaceae bacterium]
MGCVSFLPGLVEGKGAKRSIIRRLTEDKSGVTAIEYGLIAALIAVAAVVVMGTVGTNLSTVFSEVATSL